jgi:thiol-disulfide isomerase/thioredoxin
MNRRLWAIVAVLAVAAGAVVAVMAYLGRDQQGGAGTANLLDPPISGAMAQFILSRPPRPAPVAEFQDADNNSVSLLDFGGKVVLVNIWATWCAPCVKEMPALDRLQAELGDEGLEVVAVSVDLQGAKVVRPFYEKYGIKNLKIYVDFTNSFSQVVGVEAVPANLLINRGGKFVGQLIGNADWDSPEARALLRHYLAQPAPAP